MVIEEPRTSSVVTRVNSRGVVVVLAVVAEPVVRVGLAGLAAQVDLGALAVLVGLAAQVDRGALAVLVGLVAQADREALAVLAGLAAQADREALAVLAGLAAQADREALAALAGLVVPVAQLELRLVKAGPEHDPVGVVPEREPVAVPVKAKSVIAVHHRALVRVPKRAEDSAVVAAATMQEQAATEAARAWVAAA
jgi:hypothetical protein